jgi:hypothetical protein
MAGRVLDVLERLCVGQRTALKDGNPASGRVLPRR